jgi:DNA repair protein RadA/Sms
MCDAGLVGVPDPSGLFLDDRLRGINGSVVVPTIEGHRPLLVEVQALATDSDLAMPRRSAQGLDAGRLTLLLAVLRQFGKKDVHVSAVGGVKIIEPGADLAIALALTSSLCDRPIGSDVVACGEIGLGGELRQVSQTPRRLAEALRLGFRTAIVPKSAPDGPAGMTLVRARTVHEAIEKAGLHT